jgi:hypothetical protein
MLIWHGVAAAVSPGRARKFPFSAALRTRGEVSFRFRTAKWGDCHMMIKASGRSALILAAALFVCFAGPSSAVASADSATSKSAASAASGKNAKHAWRHWRKVAHRKSSGLALKSAPAGKDADIADGDGNDLSMLPPSVANANAELASADIPGGNARAMTVRANNILQAAPDSSADAQAATGTQLVAADQLNDVDRALHASDAPAPTVAMASNDAPAAAVTARTDENSTWDQTSLIGKIFIGFGALLTMASAARMFMA